MKKMDRRVHLYEMIKKNDFSSSMKNETQTEQLYAYVRNHNQIVLSDNKYLHHFLLLFFFAYS